MLVCWRRRKRGLTGPGRTLGWLGAAALLLSGCGGPTGPDLAGSDPIARVGDRVLTADAFREYLVNVFGSEDEVDGGDELLSRLLDQYLEEQTLLTRALQLELQASEADLQRFMETRAPRIDDSDPEERERFLRNVRETLLAEKLKELVFAERVKITREEIEAYYNREPERFRQSTRIQLRQILVDDRSRAEQLLDELAEDPSRFREVAEVHSEAPDRGMTGSYEEAGLPEDIRNAVAGLDSGGLSGIVQDSQGFHIFQLVGREADQELPLTEVHRDIEAILYREKSEKVLEEFLRELGDEIPVTIVEQNLGFDYIERP